MTRQLTSLLALGALCLGLTACGGSEGAQLPPGDTLTRAAHLLTMVDRPGWTEVVVDNPWDSTRVLARYALVRDSTVKVPGDYTRISVPVRRSLPMGSVYGNAAIELGACTALSGIADGQYATGQLKDMLEAGRIRNVGPAMSPSAELIATLAPEVILATPYHNAGHGEESRLGIPILEMADYMEPTPEGRSEWLLLLGELYGQRDKAKKIYTQAMADYAALRDSVPEEGRPVVLTEKAYSGVWNVPGGASYVGRMLWDAGARLPWQNDGNTGSLPWDFEQVLSRAGHADFWLMRIYGKMSLSALKEESPTYTYFHPYATGKVYYSNTSRSTIFDDVAFHPERVLREYINIFHPGILSPGQLVYFEKMPK